MKSYTLKTVVLIAVVTLFTANHSYGQDKQDRKGPPTFAKLLEEMDANDDGKLAESEVKGPLKDSFSEIDTDEDGFISEEEFKNAPKPERKKRDDK
ncbi:EF-hand domain-containing protein [Winogradskyella psychrotolerans]|uniref:EF-hand domain-containing protein n=1 Tax=Winogradskyella psychrotolerans TaxID=1344585 RepID=UPI001C068D04|nr:EF-hand domain-containing protein [Winogradskyella psychrotolerans]MBU2929679.1 EF-hand domain-containing protein [Winogradskyella psychrotolerans]